MREYSDNELFDAHRAFAATQYGETLANRVRYERYNLAELSIDEWEHLLGADVNNLKHMPLSFGLAKQYLKHGSEEVEIRDQMLLKLGLLIHDQGEAVTGDISFSLKTAEDELTEHDHFTRLQREFCPGASDEFQAMLSEARDEVVFNSDTRLGKMRADIEHLGYVRTALRASKQAAMETRPEVADGLRWLVADVLSNMTIRMIAYGRDERSPVKSYVESVASDITAALAVVTLVDFDNYPTTDRAAKIDNFTQAQGAWNNFLEERQAA